MSGLTSKAFDLTLIKRAEEMQNDDARTQGVREVLGYRRSKAYTKMLERAGVPSNALMYLPEMKPAESFPLGHRTSKLLKRIEFHYEHKPRKKDILGDDEGTLRENENDYANNASDQSKETNNNNAEDANTDSTGSEGDDDSDSDSDDDDDDDSKNDESSISEVELESESSSSSEESSESDGDSEHDINRGRVDAWDDFRDELRANRVEEPPRVVTGRLHSRDPSDYVVPDLTNIGQDLELGAQEDPVVPGIPGFASQPRPIEKDRGAKKFYNYVGRWEAGKLCGEGIYVFADGGTYRGAWIDSLPQGQGKSEYPDGSCYSGAWLKGTKHGYGVYTSPNGTKFEGYYENGKRSGQGKLTLPSKVYYEGDFWNGTFHGRGVMRSPMGYEFSGNWVRGFIQGTGALIEPDGTRTVRNWAKPITFRRVITKVKDDRASNLQRRHDFHDRLRALLFDFDLQRKVRRIRAQFEQDEIDRIEAEREELNRLRYERREQIRKAKEDALRGLNGEEEEGGEGEESEEEDDDDDEEEGDDDEDEDEDEDEMAKN